MKTAFIARNYSVKDRKTNATGLSYKRHKSAQRKRLSTNQKSVATQMPTPMQSMNTTHIKNLTNPTTLSRSTMAKPTEDTARNIYTISITVMT